MDDEVVETVGDVDDVDEEDTEHSSDLSDDSFGVEVFLVFLTLPSRDVSFLFALAASADTGRAVAIV